MKIKFIFAVFSLLIIFTHSLNLKSQTKTETDSNALIKSKTDLMFSAFSSGTNTENAKMMESIFIGKPIKIESKLHIAGEKFKENIDKSGDLRFKESTFEHEYEINMQNLEVPEIKRNHQIELNKSNDGNIIPNVNFGYSVEFVDFNRIQKVENNLLSQFKNELNYRLWNATPDVIKSANVTVIKPSRDSDYR